MKAAGWAPEPFEADDGTVPFERFIEDLSDFKFVVLDAAIRRVLAVRGIGLMRTEWLRALGRGLHEFRVRHDGDEIARMFSTEARPAAAPPGEGTSPGIRAFLRRQNRLVTRRLRQGSIPAEEASAERDRPGPQIPAPVQAPAPAPPVVDGGRERRLTMLWVKPHTVGREVVSGP